MGQHTIEEVLEWNARNADRANKAEAELTLLRKVANAAKAAYCVYGCSLDKRRSYDDKFLCGSCVSECRDLPPLWQVLADYDKWEEEKG